MPTQGAFVGENPAFSDLFIYTFKEEFLRCQFFLILVLYWFLRCKKFIILYCVRYNTLEHREPGHTSLIELDTNFCYIHLYTCYKAVNRTAYI